MTAEDTRTETAEAMTTEAMTGIDMMTAAMTGIGMMVTETVMIIINVMMNREQISGPAHLHD